LDESLLAEAKVAAARSGRTLTAVIEEALRASLGRRRSIPATARIELPTYTGRGLQPGVDLDDSAALMDLMDHGDGAA
jgi:hypothetical protein